MLRIKTTDNNCGKVISEVCSPKATGDNPELAERFSEQHYSDLTSFANTPLKELVLNNKELLVFPHCLLSEDKILDNTYGKILDSKILEMYGPKEKPDDVKISTGNLMGFVGKGNVRVEITSRFDKGQKDFFLHYMLLRVFCPNLVKLGSAASSGDFLDVLPLMFSHVLRKALSQGVYKTYRTFERNDANVKGPVNVSRHIRENIPFCGKIAYRERTRTADNPLTELVRHTIEFIKQKPFGRGILSHDKDVRNAVLQITECTPSYSRQERQKVIAKNAQPVRHPYFTEWRPLQKLCLAILNSEKIKYHSDRKNVYGILFDGAWLWEEYVNMLIGKAFYHPKNRSGDGAQYLFDKSIGRVYPDFIGRDIKNRVIADAKYKPIGNISGDDYLQVLAYMFRFEAKTGYYLYPETGKADNQELKMNRGTTYEKNVTAHDDVRVVKRGLKIPEASNFSDFSNAMRNSEEEFVKALVPV